jgi:hypothetical protein
MIKSSSHKGAKNEKISYWLEPKIIAPGMGLEPFRHGREVIQFKIR